MYAKQDALYVVEIYTQGGSMLQRKLMINEFKEQF
jgi:hypothetical protein